MTTKEIQPSDLKTWNEINQSKAVGSDFHPEWYAWYEEDGKFFPHRQPTIEEILNDKFN